jgi:hypothetical protein
VRQQLVAQVQVRDVAHRLERARYIHAGREQHLREKARRQPQAPQRAASVEARTFSTCSAGQ